MKCQRVGTEATSSTSRCGPWRSPSPRLEGLEGELPVLGQPGDSDADEPERSGPVAQPAVEQPAGEVADLPGVVDTNVERNRSAADRKIGVAELRRHRARRSPAFLQALGDLPGHRAKLVMQPLALDEVSL